MQSIAGQSGRWGLLKVLSWVRAQLKVHSQVHGLVAGTGCQELLAMCLVLIFALFSSEVLQAEAPGIYLQNILEGKCDHKAEALGYACFFSGS